MIESIMNLMLLPMMICFFILWVKALADSDGHCHFEDCENCMFQENCPEENWRNENE